jgi:hypothetical protein
MFGKRKTWRVLVDIALAVLLAWLAYKGKF